MFLIRGNVSVYFNIRKKGSVIQTFFRGEKCNLLDIYHNLQKREKIVPYESPKGTKVVVVLLLLLINNYHLDRHKFYCANAYKFQTIVFMKF